MSYEYEFLTGSLTFPPEEDRSEKIRGIQRFVHTNVKQGYRLVFLERLMGSDEFVAVMERNTTRIEVNIEPLDNSD